MYTRCEPVAARMREILWTCLLFYRLINHLQYIANKFHFTLSVVILSGKVLYCISVNNSTLNFHFLRINVTVLRKFNAFTNSTGRNHEIRVFITRKTLWRNEITLLIQSLLYTIKIIFSVYLNIYVRWWPMWPTQDVHINTIDLQSCVVIHGYV